MTSLASARRTTYDEGHMSSVAAARTKRRILVVEDDPDVRRTLERCLLREGCEVTLAVDGKEAAEKIDRARPELVLTDLEMPRAGGREVVALAVQRRVPVVVLTGHGTVQAAVELMRAGAANFLTKPFTPETLRSVLSDTFGRAPAGEVVGNEEAFRDVLDIVGAVAETDATILITGESGTGKEVVARTIHRASKRARGPFVAVNCGAIPEALLESELFGHKKGSFTGAVADRRGLFQAAHGGTLFLDEIGDMPLPLQVKLLRVLQEGEVRPVGSTQPMPVDVRVISATHRDLESQREQGHFREDLYYRLNVVSLKLPSLAERREDIPLLAVHILRRLAERYRKPPLSLAPDAMALLVAAPWPGNVRQLLNLLEQAVALATTPVIPATLVQAALKEDAAALIPFEEARKTFERDYLVRLLKITGGNVTQAAQLAKRNRTEFYKLLQRHRLEPGMFKEAKT